MKKSLLSGIAALTAAALLGAGLAACAPPEKRGGGEQTQSGVKAADATSAKDFGGMDGLVDAAKKEGELNVYSDDGQNLNAAGGVRPVRADGMLTAGTIDKAAIDNIPVIDGPVTVPTPDQTDKATKDLADNWAKAIG